MSAFLTDDAFMPRSQTALMARVGGSLQVAGPISPSANTLDPIALLLADKRSPATRRAYAADLADFFASEDNDGPTPLEQVKAFLNLSAPQIALRLAEYKAGLLKRGLSEATVNRRLAAVRSLLKLSYRLGLASTDGRGLVDGEKTQAYRDTRGIDLTALRRLVALPLVVFGPDSLRGRRDTALLRLLCENALRRAEVSALDVEDFSSADKRLQIRGKGKGTQKMPVTLSPRCTEALAAYLAVAGHGEQADGPLFRNLDRRQAKVPQGFKEGDRLTHDGLYWLIGFYGRLLERPLTPHKLRHSAITAALDATGGDVRRVQKLSRHADLRTLSIYDDNRSDFQGEVTGILSGLL